MNSRVLVISFLLTVFIFSWGSFIYLNFGVSRNIYGDLNLQGWNHGLITGVVLPLILIAVFSAAFISRSLSSALSIYVITAVLVFFIGGVGLLIYRSEGCPRPYTLKSLEARKAELADPQKFLADWKIRYQKGNPTDTWEPGDDDFEKERIRFEKDFDQYKKGCSGFYLTAEKPETYEAFIGSLAGDVRLAFYLLVNIILIAPLAFVGKLLGKWILK